MKKNFKTKDTDGRLIIKKIFFGIGFHLNFVNSIGYRDIKFSLIIDFIFMRFWINVYK